MVVGFTAFVLILYNGFIDPPGDGPDEIGITSQIGYYVALVASVGIAVAGIARSMEAQKGTRAPTETASGPTTSSAVRQWPAGRVGTGSRTPSFADHGCHLPRCALGLAPRPQPRARARPRDRGRGARGGALGRARREGVGRRRRRRRDAAHDRHRPDGRDRRDRRGREGRGADALQRRGDRRRQPAERRHRRRPARGDDALRRRHARRRSR